MKKRNILLASLIAATSAFSLVACSGTGYSNMVINEADRNNDKLMTYEEYYDLITNNANASEYIIQARGRGKTVRQYSFEEFNKMDTNRDGLVSSEEVKAYTFR